VVDAEYPKVTETSSDKNEVLIMVRSWLELGPSRKPIYGTLDRNRGRTGLAELCRRHGDAICLIAQPVTVTGQILIHGGADEVIG
jgi:hypothetical protein